jgi:hypothetical protein
MKTKLLRKLRKKYKKDVRIKCYTSSTGESIYWVYVKLPKICWLKLYECTRFCRRHSQSKCRLCNKFGSPFNYHYSMDGAIAQASCYIDAGIYSYIRRVRKEQEKERTSCVWKNFKL